MFVALLTEAIIFIEARSDTM